MHLNLFQRSHPRPRCWDPRNAAYPADTCWIEELAFPTILPW